MGETEEEKERDKHCDSPSSHWDALLECSLFCALLHCTVVVHFVWLANCSILQPFPHSPIIFKVPFMHFSKFLFFFPQLSSLPDLKKKHCFYLLKQCLEKVAVAEHESESSWCLAPCLILDCTSWRALTIDIALCWWAGFGFLKIS